MGLLTISSSIPDCLMNADNLAFRLSWLPVKVQAVIDWTAL
jgi:hypothetical protein